LLDLALSGQAVVPAIANSSVSAELEPAA